MRRIHITLRRIQSRGLLDHVLFRQIRLGESAGAGLVEVLAGVSAGERVALEPIKAGMATPSKPGGS
jgi:chorismate synthase